MQYKKHTWQIYGAQGHDRFGKVTPKPYLVHYITPPDTTMFLRALRQKFYEHKDHLGNVRMTFSDMKNRTATGIFYLDSLTARDYCHCGMLHFGKLSNF